MRKEFDFIQDEEDRETAKNVAFGIGILFGAMAVVIGLLGIWTACCHKKCCTCCVSH
jgi:hypothetical protein